MTFRGAWRKRTLVPDAPVELDELVDLKMLPAWVNEPAPTERYAGHEGEDRLDRRSRDRRPRDKRGPDRKRSRPGFDRPTQKGKDRKSTRLNSSHLGISYAVFCLK